MVSSLPPLAKASYTLSTALVSTSRSTVGGALICAEAGPLTRNLSPPKANVAELTAPSLSRSRRFMSAPSFSRGQIFYNAFVSRAPRSARASELAHRGRPQGSGFPGPRAARHLLADRRVHHHQTALRIDEDRLTVNAEQREHAPLAGEDPRLIAVAEKPGRG